MQTALHIKKNACHTINITFLAKIRLLCLLLSILPHNTSGSCTKPRLQGMYRLFLESNEIKCPDEARLMLAPGTAIVAVSGMMILDLITKTPKETWGQLYIIDKSKATEHLWIHLFNTFTNEDEFDALPLSLEYSSFKEDFVKHLQDNASVYWPESDKLSIDIKIKRLKDKIDLGHSWLSTEETFRLIKNKFVNQEVHFIRGDLSNQIDLRILLNLIETQREIIKFIYLSNIHEYVKEEKKEEDYIACLKSLSKSDFITNDTKVLATSLRDSVCDSRRLLPITCADQTKIPLRRTIFNSLSVYLIELASGIRSASLHP